MFIQLVLNSTTINIHTKKEDITVEEVAKGDSGSSKYQFDRHKLFLESKVIIDNFLRDKQDVDTVYSVQLCGLEMMIMSLSLSVNGLYVGNEAYRVSLNDQLQHYRDYIQIVKQLLCFRNEAAKVYNVSDNIKASNMRNRTSVKGYKYNKTSEDKPTNMYKSSWMW